MTGGLEHFSTFDFAYLPDGRSYLTYARAIAGDPAALLTDPWSQRVFPGYPILIALVHTLGLSLPVSALAINWLSTGSAAVAAAFLFEDVRVGWAMAVLTPGYLMYSTMAMSEPTLLLFTLVGLLLAERRATVPAGLLLGFAGVIRPVACFAVIGYVTYLVLHRRWREAIPIGLLSSAVVGAALVGTDRFLGDAFRSYHIYATEPGAFGGHLLTVPFRSLITTSMAPDIPLWKTLYTWGCVAFSLLGCYLLARRWWQAYQAKTDPGWLSLAATWAIGNTAFALCLGGGIWGFQEFHRWMLPALPPLLLAYQSVLPRKPGGVLLLAGLSFAPALYGMHRHASRSHAATPGVCKTSEDASQRGRRCRDHHATQRLFCIGEAAQQDTRADRRRAASRSPQQPHPESVPAYENRVAVRAPGDAPAGVVVGAPPEAVVEGAQKGEAGAILSTLEIRQAGTVW